MNTWFAILGRQPALSLAELESIYGAETVSELGPSVAHLNTEPTIKKLGGTLKIGRLVGSVERSDQAGLAELCARTLSEVGPDGKLTFGLSLYGSLPFRADRFAISLKSSVSKTRSGSVRYVQNKDPKLNTAQVLHNGLLKERGRELVLVVAGKQVWVGVTSAVQDIGSYTRRDRLKPVRDRKVGMLPPKLAQTMINLAQPIDNAIILDPFCGTGTVLMEALELGYGALGSDLSPDMVKAAQKNLEWYCQSVGTPAPVIEELDAATADWGDFDTVVAETYLGPPLRFAPTSAKLGATIEELDKLHRRVLENMHHQLAAGTRICLAVPTWMLHGQRHQLPVVDDLEKLGYNRVSFAHASNEEMIYHRSEQVVARQLLVLIRK